ncbi:MAG TPA: COX15/CtaA family protein [Longimicrobiales bacterium]
MSLVQPPETFETATSLDWRTSIPEQRRRWLRAWFWSIAAMTLCVLIVGGVTRLTFSGLSIVDWDPLMGVIPPLSEGQWQATFERYQQFPEYQKTRQGMTLGEFKYIFFWEYLHRLLARTIGLVFLLPFLFFLVRRWMNRPLAYRSLALFALGGMQGVMGWLMVASGLVDRPSVSHFRLAAHLTLAFLIFGYAVWLARELRVTDARLTVNDRALRVLKRGLAWVGVLLGLQIVWGAFVAGLKAGFFANTFPLMGGRIVPRDLLRLEPALRNFVSNGIAVQWLHRLLGTVLVLAVFVLLARISRARPDRTTLRYATAFVTLVSVQYLLGIATLLLAVPVPLGVTHQVTALILFGIWIMWVHHTRQLVASSDARV